MSSQEWHALWQAVYKSCLNHKLIQWSQDMLLIPTTCFIPSTKGTTWWIRNMHPMTSWSWYLLKQVITMVLLWLIQVASLVLLWGVVKLREYIIHKWDFMFCPWFVSNHFPTSICTHILYMNVILANSGLLTFSRTYHAMLPSCALFPHPGMSSLPLFSPLLHMPPQLPSSPSVYWNLTQPT